VDIEPVNGKIALPAILPVIGTIDRHLLFGESLPNRYSSLYNWPMSAHATQAFSIARYTDSEDLLQLTMRFDTE